MLPAGKDRHDLEEETGQQPRVSRLKQLLLQIVHFH